VLNRVGLEEAGSGGIRLHVVNYNTGFLVNTPEEVAYRIRCLLLHKGRT